MIRKNVSLGKYSNYKIGTTAEYFAKIKNIKQIPAIIKGCKREIFVLGGGTNILFESGYLPKLVIKPEIDFIKNEDGLIRVGAGTPMKKIVEYAAKKGLSGVEWAAGLPGTVGGAVFGNAGAFRGEMKNSVHQVISVNLKNGKITKRSKSACGFGYRASIFKKNAHQEMIAEILLKLKKGKPSEIRRLMKNNISYRIQNQPMEHPSIGSIFKNVDLDKIPKKHLSRMHHVIKTDPFPVIPAAYLISEAGLKGISFGGAMFSPKHPNFIVNVLNAESRDVRALILLAKHKVREKFGIELNEEIISA